MRADSVSIDVVQEDVLGDEFILRIALSLYEDGMPPEVIYDMPSDTAMRVCHRIVHCLLDERVERRIGTFSEASVAGLLNGALENLLRAHQLAFGEKID